MTPLLLFTKTKIDDFHDHLNEQKTDIQFAKEIEENGKLSFLDCLVSRNTNELRTTVLQKTDAYRHITWRIILQPDFTQSHDYKDSKETSATSLRHTWQLTRRKQIPWTCFSQKKTTTTTTRTLLDETFTDVPKLTLLTGIQHLLLQWLYLTYIKGTYETISEFYSPTTFV